MNDSSDSGYEEPWEAFKLQLPHFLFFELELLTHFLTIRTLTRIFKLLLF